MAALYDEHNTQSPKKVDEEQTLTRTRIFKRQEDNKLVWTRDKEPVTRTVPATF